MLHEFVHKILCVLKAFDDGVLLGNVAKKEINDLIVGSWESFRSACRILVTPIQLSVSVNSVCRFSCFFFLLSACVHKL
jgi:hypothetical protein